MMDPIIKTESVNRIFKAGTTQVHALKDISIEVMPNTITILKGRSGSGKTTLINLLGTLDRPTSGKIYFCGNEIGHTADGRRDKLRRKKMGFVFQSVALISLMSAYENVEFALRVSGFRRGRRKRAESCLNFVGLRNRMHHRPGELSGGEQQRVAIARAVAHQPLVVFADEPTAELDTHMGLQVMKLFRDLVINENATIVMTTHDPNMMELADRVYTLEDGEVTDTLENVIERNGVDLEKEAASTAQEEATPASPSNTGVPFVKEKVKNKRKFNPIPLIWSLILRIGKWIASLFRKKPKKSAGINDAAPADADKKEQSVKKKGVNPMLWLGKRIKKIFGRIGKKSDRRSGDDDTV